MKRINIIVFSLLISLFIFSSFLIAAQYESEVYQAQKALKARGYNPGTPDGLWGKSTESAIKHFQVDIGLPVTGKLDEQTKAKLGLVSSDRSVRKKLQTDEQRVALVIGNSAYQYAPLKNPQNDAVDMASSLNNLDFKVTQKLNASKREIEEAINGFGRELRKGGVGLFYFAGHGVQVDGINYLIPIGTNIESEGDVKYEAVNANRVLSKMQDAGNSLNLVFLDACRNNPFTRRFRSAEQGLAPMDAPKGSFVAYATAPGDVAAEGDGRNGIFTKHLLRYMREPGLEVGKMMRRVRVGVQNDTGGKQTPFEVSSLTGDFYFALVGTPEPQSPVPLSDERAKLERERRELERLRLEIERKKLEAERKRLEEEQKKNTIVTSIDPKDREIGRDDHYVAYANGVVRDTKTGLEWFVGPDKDTEFWNDAKIWVDNLKVDGGGWRMPTMDELESLYQMRKGSRNMTPLLKTTGWFVWSGETESSSSAWPFNFRYGNRDWYDRYGSYDARAFAVRSRSYAEIQRPKKDTPKNASIRPEVSTIKVIGRDDHYIVYASGVVRDTKTGLEWVAGPDKAITWNEAKRWVDNLTISGGGWRMPTMDELESLYQMRKGDHNMTPLLKTTGNWWFAWSGEIKDSSSAWGFDFYRGGRLWDRRYESGNTRAFAVRSRK